MHHILVYKQENQEKNIFCICSSTESYYSIVQKQSFAKSERKIEEVK